MMTTKYPNVTVQLSGTDSNAGMIISRVARELRHAGVSEEEIAKFNYEARNGDYDNVLTTVIRWVDVS
jgi:hypothetical protein